MSVQRVPLEAVQKIRQYIKAVLVLPESENHPQSHPSADNELMELKLLSDLGSLFNLGEPVHADLHVPNRKGQWFISSVNPGAVLQKLPGLTLKPNLRLVSYLYRVPDDGVGITWALPETQSTTAQLEKVLASSHDRSHPPQPMGALADVMEAIEGDRSPVSYVIASILRRELQEFGTLGKSCDWAHHRLMTTLPNQAIWKWRIEMPKDLSPKVCIFPDGRAVVEFFTCRMAAPVSIFRHIDQYSTGQYTAASLDRPIAVAQRA